MCRFGMIQLGVWGPLVIQLVRGVEYREQCVLWRVRSQVCRPRRGLQTTGLVCLPAWCAADCEPGVPQNSGHTSVSRADGPVGDCWLVYHGQMVPLDTVSDATGQVARGGRVAGRWTGHPGIYPLRPFSGNLWVVLRPPVNTQPVWSIPYHAVLAQVR